MARHNRPPTALEPHHSTVEPLPTGFVSILHTFRRIDEFASVCQDGKLPIAVFRPPRHPCASEPQVSVRMGECNRMLLSRLKSKELSRRARKSRDGRFWSLARLESHWLVPFFRSDSGHSR